MTEKGSSRGEKQQYDLLEPLMAFFVPHVLANKVFEE